MAINYIDINKILSRGAILNIITSPRGPGKSWAMKDRAITQFLKYGKLFIYCRRTEEEMSLTKDTHFNDILAKKYNGKYEVKAKSYKFFIRETAPEDLEGKEKGQWEKEHPWKLFGYAIPVSKQQSFKSSGMINVSTIYYDEFIPDNPWSRINPDEVKQFLNLIETVTREQKPHECKIFMLSNTGFIANPYFQFYDIKSEDFIDREFIKRKGGAVCVWYYRYSEDDKEKASQKVSSLIGGDEYMKASVEGHFKDISDALVKAQKPTGVEPVFNMTSINGRYFRVFQGEGEVWVDEGKKITRLRSFTFDRWELYKDSEYDEKILKKIEKAVNRRQLSFSSADVKATFISKLKKSQ